MPIDKTKEYQTRDGRKARIYATDCGSRFSVHGAFEYKPNEWQPCSWTAEGKLDCGNSLLDLIEKRKRIKLNGVVRVYHNGDKFCIGGTYLTREDALSHSFMNQTVALIPITIEGFEGDGLEEKGCGCK